LAAAGFGVAELAESHGEAAKLNGDYAEGVAAVPLDAMLEATLADFAGVASEDADGVLYGNDGGNGDEDGGSGEEIGDASETGGGESAMGEDQEPEHKTGE
jgi:hypothetical protein